jgi:hypothetical protein
MRKEAVYTVLLNVTLFHGMRCVLAQDPRYLRFSVIESGGTTHYNLRVSLFPLHTSVLLSLPYSGIECEDCAGTHGGDQC